MMDYGMFVIKHNPGAEAIVKGSDAYPNIRGKVQFYQMPTGVIVVADVSGLPDAGGKCAHPVYAMHIHSGNACTGNKADPFADSGTHYNPEGCTHPYHAGDLPPLFANKGNAWYAFVTDRFMVKDIKNKTVIIHEKPDDFTTQPAGNSGKKIACGEIK